MKRIVLVLIAALSLAGGVAVAHGDAEHVRGTVTNITDTAITVQVSAKETRTVTVNGKTMVMRGASHLSLKDVKVGDRVVLDVDKKSALATEVKLAAAAPTSAKAAPTSQKRKG